MSYVRGQSTRTQTAVRETADQVRDKLDNLRRMEAAIDAEQAAKEAELARIRAARLRLAPVATYKPTLEALAYREEHGHAIAAQPAPLHGGRLGLTRATREAAEHEEAKRAAA